MVAAIFLLSIAIAGGTILTFLFDQDMPLLPRLCMGSCAGMALMTSIGFVVASLIGKMNVVCLLIPAMLLLLPLLLLMHAEYGKLIRENIDSGLKSLTTASFRDKVFVTYLVFFIGMALVLGMLFSHTVYERPDGLYTDFVNNISDLPFHLGIIDGFLKGHNFPPQDPAFAQDPTIGHARFNYPFLSDFLAAMFMLAGAKLAAALWLENFILGFCMVGLLCYWTVSLTGSRLAGLIAPLLVIFSGSMGWIQIFDDLRKSSGAFWPPAFLNLLGHLNHDYSLVNEGNSLYRWGNSMTVLFVPQRSILFGVPLCLCIFAQWWKAREGPDAMRRMLAAGVLAGLLPLIHAHSFLVVMGIGFCLALLFFRQWKAWLLFFVAACAIAGPEILWNMHGSTMQTKEFYGINWGWDHGKNDPVWFWFVNAGPFILLLLGALLVRSEQFKLSKRLVMYYSPFLLLFIGPNIFRLAPWVWDNIKVLFYWYVGSAPLVALMLVQIWRTPGRRWLAPVLLATITLSGFIDITRVLTAGIDMSSNETLQDYDRSCGQRYAEPQQCIARATSVKEFDSCQEQELSAEALACFNRSSIMQEYDKDEMAFAKIIEQHTEPRAIVLYSPGWKPPIYLTGRRSLLGYPGIIWSRGLGRYDDREEAIKSIYSGAPDADQQIQRWGIQYVEVGPTERSADGYQVNDSFFSRFPLIAENGPYRLYKVGSGQ